MFTTRFSLTKVLGEFYVWKELPKLRDVSDSNKLIHVEDNCFRHKNKMFSGSWIVSTASYRIKKPGSFDNSFLVSIENGTQKSPKLIF